MAKAELLAPAGSMASLDAALRYGADAVYIGGTMLQLRAKSAGFTLDKIAEAAEGLSVPHFAPITGKITYVDNQKIVIHV